MYKQTLQMICIEFVESYKSKYMFIQFFTFFAVLVCRIMVTIIII